MGKSLIFTNADFSAVAIENAYREMPLTQGGVYLIPNDAKTGNQWPNYAGRSNFTDAFYWENGAKLRIRGLKGKNGTYSPLKIDGGIYSSRSWGHDTIVNTMNGMTTSYYPINVGGTTDEIELTNTWGSYWFVFSFSPQNGSDNIPVSDFKIEIRL